MRNRVLYWGFGPLRPSGRPDIGGFRSGTKMVVESRRFDHTDLTLCPCTHREDGGRVRRLLEDARRFRRSLRRHPDHACVMMQVGQYQSIYREALVAWMAKAARRKLVADIRAGSLLDFLDRDSNALQRRLFRSLVEKADLCLVQCAGFLPELRRRHPTATFDWFPNFIREDWIRPRRAPSFRSGEPLRLVYFGHYNRAKGVPQLIEAASRLRSERGLQIELHLAGEVRDEDAGRALAGADSTLVTDHGLLDPETLWELLREMHAFVFATTHYGEGHTNAVNEALMSGLVVVATRHQHLPHILPEEGTLWIEEGRMVDSIMERIEFLTTHPDFVNRVAQANQAYVRERFTDSRWIPFLEQKFDALTAEERWDPDATVP